MASSRTGKDRGGERCTEKARVGGEGREEEKRRE